MLSISLPLTVERGFDLSSPSRTIEKYDLTIVPGL
jgi:hypothetical protein